jgi:cell wall-associated NlpC family hydrolase
MTRNILIGMGCLLLAGLSCTGNSGAKTKSQQAGKQAASATASDSDIFQIQLFYASDSDRIVFDNYLTYIKPFRNEPILEVVSRTAQFFEGKPYAASTLEIEPEGLVINLRTFDCTTFVETVLALAQTVKRYEQPTFDHYCSVLRNIRYRRGTIKDYTSRNHYFSDWIYENENREYVKDITQTLGGAPCQLHLHFMSSHPERYRQLASHPEFVDILREKEAEITQRTLYALIPTSKVGEAEKDMRSGDIVCFATDIEGLDVSHVGFVHQEKGRCTFIHASTSAKKVIVEPQSLQSYLTKSKRNIGLMVVRPFFFK